jgi:hypothetical protein
MDQPPAIEESPLDLILMKTLEKLRESGVMPDTTLLRLQSIIQEGKLGNRNAVMSALKIPEENGE